MKILAAVVAWTLTGCVVVVENQPPAEPEPVEVVTSINNSDDYTSDDVVTINFPLGLR